jgi:beta-lactamase regulating signal transducer with metallopeptidase domain
MSNASEYALWCELGLILTVATVGVVSVVWLVERWLTSGLARRAVWQTGLIAIVVLAAIEVSGGGQIATQWVRAGWRSLCLVTQNSTDEPPGHAVAFSRPARAGTASRPVNQVETASGLDLWWYGQPSPRDALLPSGADAATEAVRGHSGSSAGQSVAPLSRTEHEQGPETLIAHAAPRIAAAHQVDAAPPLGSFPQRVAVVPSRLLPVPEPAVWPAVCWLAGSGLVALYILLGYLALARFRRHAVPLADSGLLRRIERLASRLRIRRPVRVLQSERLKTPAAFGILQATIALPARFDQQFPEQQQDAILTHELAHLAAADPAWHLAANLLTALLWWQPAVWLLRHRLQLASELAADEATLILPAGPEHLATSLVAIARRLIDRPRLGWVPMTGDGYRSNLGRRVGRLLNLKPNRRMDLRRGPTTWIRCVCVVVLVFCMILGSAWLRPQAALAEGESTMTKLKMTWSRSLAAAAVALVLGPLGGDAPADGTLPDADQLESATEVQVALLQDDREEREREEAERDEREGEEREGREEREGDERREREGDREREARERDARAPEGRERERDERAPEARERGEREREERVGGERERAMHNLERERGELLERAAHLKREIAGLPENADEPHRQLGQELEEILHAVRRVEQHLAEVRGGDRPRLEGPPEELLQRMMREREELMELGRNVMRELEEFKRSGNEAAAREAAEKLERIKREVGQLEARAREAQGRRGRPGPPPEEVERRMHHLRMAAENLHAAGLHDQAEQLMREADRIAHGPEGPGPKPEPERREMPHGGDLERAVHELNRQVDEMRGQMEEMRNALKTLLERQER